MKSSTAWTVLCSKHHDYSRNRVHILFACWIAKSNQHLLAGLRGDSSASQLSHSPARRTLVFQIPRALCPIDLARCGLSEYRANCPHYISQIFWPIKFGGLSNQLSRKQLFGVSTRTEYSTLWRITSAIRNTGRWHRLWRSHVLRQGPVFAAWLR